MRFSNIQLLPALLRDHLVERLRVDALAHAERHRLGGGGDVHAGEQLVDDLDLGAGAGAVAEPVDLARPSRPARPRTWRRPRGAPEAIIVISPARRLGGAAGHRRVDIQQPALGQPRARARSAQSGSTVAHSDEHAARAHAPRPRRRSPNSTSSVCAALTTSDTTTSQAAASSAGVAQAMPPSAANAASTSRAHRRRGCETGAQQRARHAHAHRAQADHADVRYSCSYPCVVRRSATAAINRQRLRRTRKLRGVHFGQPARWPVRRRSTRLRTSARVRWSCAPRLILARVSGSNSASSSSVIDSTVACRGISPPRM